MTDYAFSTHLCHEHQMKNTRPILSFDPARDYTAWRTELAAKLRQLVGDETERVEPDIRIEYDRQEPGFREIRFIFTSEPGADVPCHLLIPDGAKQPVPVVICL